MLTPLSSYGFYEFYTAPDPLVSEKDAYMSSNIVKPKKTFFSNLLCSVQEQSTRNQSKRVEGELLFLISETSRKHNYRPMNIMFSLFSIFTFTPFPMNYQNI